MYPIPGHLALAASSARLIKVSVLAAVIGSFAPDIVDKSLNDIFHLIPYGRHFMHCFLSSFVCGGLLWLIVGKDWGIGWFVGHFSHIIGDLGSFTTVVDAVRSIRLASR